MWWKGSEAPVPGQDLVPISVNTRHSPARAPAYLLQRDGVEAFSANLTGKVMPVLPFFLRTISFQFYPYYSVGKQFALSLSAEQLSVLITYKRGFISEKRHAAAELVQF